MLAGLSVGAFGMDDNDRAAAKRSYMPNNAIIDFNDIVSYHVS
jgi:hypothetical protein